MGKRQFEKGMQASDVWYGYFSFSQATTTVLPSSSWVIKNLGTPV
jgi:hypothetical protein